MRSPHSPELHQFKNSVLQPPLSVGRSKICVISCLGGTIVRISLNNVFLNLSRLCSPLAAEAGEGGGGGTWEEKYCYFSLLFLTPNPLMV